MATSSGGRGGKGLTQGEQPTGGRGSDSAPSCHVDPIGAVCAELRAGPHRLLADVRPKGGARCVSSARRDLCGGRGVILVPTVTHFIGDFEPKGNFLTLIEGLPCHDRGRYPPPFLLVVSRSGVLPCVSPAASVEAVHENNRARALCTGFHFGWLRSRNGAANHGHTGLADRHDDNRRPLSTTAGATVPGPDRTECLAVEAGLARTCRAAQGRAQRIADSA